MAPAAGRSAPLGRLAAAGGPALLLLLLLLLLLRAAGGRPRAGRGGRFTGA
ncbi:MAG: hypothetical protein ICV73_23220, partial [Acetobacteraceae bacterium]|nr:hypothetical protein [Acetobacteraceae bacterium]